MTTVRPETVGRSWYVQIIAGPLGSQVFLGTHHVATGNQAWMRMDWGTDMASLTEGEILDELWAACMSLMEARTSIG